MTLALGIILNMTLRKKKKKQRKHTKIATLVARIGSNNNISTEYVYKTHIYIIYPYIYIYI